MAASHAFIASILEKMKSHDSDYRYMAISDFESELQNESFCMDMEAEKKICNSMIILLDDRSVEVQGKTVTCLRLLVRKIHDVSLQQIVTKLVVCAATSQQADKRDIAVVGLNGVIDSIHESQGRLIVEQLIPKLCETLKKGASSTASSSSSATSEGIAADCLGLLAHVLARFGQNVDDTMHGEIQRAVVTHLGNNSRRNVRKLAVGCIANLSMYLSDQAYADIVNYSLHYAQQSSDPEQVRTHIQLLGQISHYSELLKKWYVGHRLGLFMEKVIPLISQTVTSEVFSDDTELKENCFQTFESLIERCPREVSSQLEEIINLGLQFIQYDPNYTGCDAEDGSDIDGEEEDWGYEGGESDDEFDYDVEDDDLSGKVRKACAKMLGSIAICHPETLPLLHQKVVPVLVQRFSEREEYVKLDVFSSFISILRSTSKSCRVSSAKGKMFVGSLKQYVAPIVATMVKQLGSKQTKAQTKEGIFGVLREMAAFSESIFEKEHVTVLIPGVIEGMNERQVQRKGIVLQFLRDLLFSHPADYFQDHFEPICKATCSILQDSHSKQVSADGLRVAERLIGILRPAVRAAIAMFVASPLSVLPEGEASQKVDSTMTLEGFTEPLYQACLVKLQDTQVDSEVKECSIECMGILLAVLGDKLLDNMESCLAILMSRLKNEVVRLATVRAFISIVVSPLNIDLKGVIAKLVENLSSFLRKSNRSLRQTSLVLLAAIVKSGRLTPQPQLYGALFTDLSSLLSDSDLQLCHLSFILALVCMQADPSNISHLRVSIYPKVLLLLKSPLLQGNALETLLELFPLLVKQGSEEDTGVDQILETLIAQGRDPTGGKQSAISIAKCVAVTTTQCPPEKQSQIVNRFVSDIRAPNQGWGLLFALLCVGEIGRRIDLSTVVTELFSVIVGAFEIESASEEIRSAASFALGGVIAGNLNAYLYVAIEEIQESPRRRYFLLHALKEMVCSLSATENGIERLRPHLSSIIPILMDNYCHSEKEGMRTVVAECLGRIALVNPEIVSSMHNQLSNSDPAVRCTMLLALRHVIVEKPQSVDQILSPLQNGLMEGFLNHMRDTDLSVRRAALMVLMHAAHVKPALIISLLPQVLSVLYTETKLDPNLMRQVEFGPFRHSVDDGLPVRKAAFECMYTLLDHCIEHLNLREYVGHLCEGLKDVYDIKMLCHLILIRLTETNYGAAAVAGQLVAVLDPLRMTITKTLKETAVKQDIDRNEEQIRSALRAVYAISIIPHVEKHLRFRDFLAMIRSGPLRDRYECVQLEKSDVGALTMSGSLGESMEYSY